VRWELRRLAEHEAVANRGEHEGDFERRGVFEALLHAVTDAMIIVPFAGDHPELAGVIVQ
jgi:hypothetical protein